ncbi:MAG: helix-turn-helix transcriptional regulator [Rhodospirillales bacterium]|nr:helix-turn-helix transcriptional regulator [Rhodospirillales bacterium]
MQRKSLAGTGCPVAETLDVIGEWWTLLVVRDVFRGIRRFDALQESLGIARNILARRLRALVAAGILEKRPYAERPPRYEYRLTEKGRALFPVLVTLMSWGNAWALPAESRKVRLVDAETGRTVEPLLVDAATGTPLDPRKLRLA